MRGDGGQRVSLKDWPGRAPGEPLPQAVVLPGRVAKDLRLWVSVATGILTALLALRRIVRLLPGLGVGGAVSAVVGAVLLLTWLTTGPQVSEVSCPEHPEGSCVRLAWGWTDLDTIVFDRRGLTMVPVRLGGSQ